MDEHGVTTCVTCGKKYRMCKTCAHSEIPYVAWRATACCPACYAVATVINDHFYTKISAREARERLVNTRWEEIDGLLPDVREYIERVLDEAAAADREEKKAVMVRKKVVDVGDAAK